MNKYFFSLIFVFLQHVYCQKNILPVVPEPKEITFLSDKFLIKNTNIQIESYHQNDEPINIALNDLAKLCQRFQNSGLSSEKMLQKKIILGILNGYNKFNEKLRNYKNLLENKLNDEGYFLLIRPDSILIAANSTRGIFYGLQTLKQIILSYKDSLYLPGVMITDWPTFKYRAVMDDISRGPVPTIEFIKYQIRRLSELKINTFTHYVEHVVKTKSHPEFAPDGGSITIEEWRELSDYAKKYNMTLIGNFQSFGHFENILKTAKYSNLGECGTLISPVNPESYRFLEDIYSEMIPSFDSKYFNVNCDETFDLGKGASKTLVDSIGYGNVYFQHIMKLYDILKKLKKEMIVWGDILLEYPLLLEKLPKDIIIATWNYDDLDSFSKFIEPIKNAGFQFFVTPGVLNSSRLFPDYDQSLKNIKKFLKDAEKSNALGVITTFWDDGGTALFGSDWYGAAYCADRSWNPNSGDSGSFDFRCNLGIYGCEKNNYTQINKKINEIGNFEPTFEMNDRILTEKIIPDSGKPLKIGLNDWEKVLKNCNESEDLVNRVKLNNYSEDKDYINFCIKLYKMLASERINLVEASNYYRLTGSILKKSKDEAVKHIKNILSIIEKLSENRLSVKSEFEILWFRENYKYSLDRISKHYQLVIDDFYDIKEKLLLSLRKLESNKNISSISEVRLDLREIRGKYFREWLITNPLPNVDQKLNSQIDYLKSIGGEDKVVPKVTQEFYYESKKFRWRRFANENPDIVNFNDAFPNTKNNVIYAFATIESETDQTIKAMIGFSNGITIFNNGIKYFENENSDKIVVDESEFSLKLSKGKNNLMLKISNVNGDWGFTFRLPECEVRNKKNKYKIFQNKD